MRAPDVTGYVRAGAAARDTCGWHVASTRYCHAHPVTRRHARSTARTHAHKQRQLTQTQTQTHANARRWHPRAPQNRATRGRGRGLCRRRSARPARHVHRATRACLELPRAYTCACKPRAWTHIRRDTRTYIRTRVRTHVRSHTKTHVRTHVWTNTGTLSVMCGQIRTRMRACPYLSTHLSLHTQGHTEGLPQGHT